MFKSILVPIDIVHRSSWQFALPQAIELAVAARGRLKAMTVIPEFKAMVGGVHLAFQAEEMISAAKTTLTRILADYGDAGVSIDREVRLGSIWREILSVAESDGADLIVMASHRPEMRDYLIGPNAAHVAQRAACSVLVLRRFQD